MKVRRERLADPANGSSRHSVREHVRSQKLLALPVIPKVSEAEARRDPKLISLLDDAAMAHRLMVDHRDLDVPGLAAQFGCEMDRYSRLVRLNYLAPDIQLAIRDGAQPDSLTKQVLLKAELPLDWATQRTLLGFASQPEHFRNPNGGVQPTLSSH